MMHFLKSILSLIDENKKLHKRIDLLEKELEINKNVQAEFVDYSKQVALAVSEIALELGNVLAYIREIGPDDTDVLTNNFIPKNIKNKNMFN